MRKMHFLVPPSARNPVAGQRAYVAKMRAAAQAARDGDLDTMQAFIQEAEASPVPYTQKGALKPKHIKWTLDLWRDLREARQTRPVEISPGGVDRPQWMTAGQAGARVSGKSARVLRPKYVSKQRGFRQWEKEFMAKLRKGTKMRNPYYHYRHRRRRLNKARRKTRRWIKKAVKRPGALRAKLTRWYGLKKNQLIPMPMLSKAYWRAKKAGDTRTMRQVMLARRLKSIAARRRKKKPAKRRGKVLRGRFRPASRRRAANSRKRRKR